MPNGFNYRERDLTKKDKAKPGSSGKVRKQDNFRMAMSMHCNWADLDTGIMYHIQEYKEALDNPKISADKKPTKIRMTRISDGKELGWEDAYIVEQKMKDPPVDPRY